MAEHGPHSVDWDQPDCGTCRRRKVKGCDNGQPHCNNCISGGLACDNSSRSFPANLASSAVGLLRDTFSSKGDQVGAALLQTLHEGSKAGSSSGVAGPGSSLTYQSTPRSEFAFATGVTSENETFRSGIRPPNAPREAFEGMTIDQFLQSEQGSKVNFFEDGQQVDKGKKAVYSNSTGDVNKYDTLFNSAWQSGTMEKASGGPGINSLNDGDEVIKLLSDPNFQPGLWMENNPGELYTITEEEMQISRWFTQNTQFGAPQREQFQQAVVAACSGRAYQEFSSIFNEIESYNEDVWGYIRPLVEAARQEEKSAGSTVVGDGPAVHRLRMIVAHLQAPAHSDSTKPLS